MDAQTAVRLTQAIREHSSMELSQIREAGEHGADAGWPGFTYTTDGAEFTAGNRALIWQLLADDAEDYGADSVLTFIADFTRSDMAETPDGFDCLLAWYALETCGRFWADRAENRTAA